MNKKEAIKQAKYYAKKRWFYSMFKEWEWNEYTGKDILHDARLLGYKISTNVFYDLRREIMEDFDPPEQPHVPSMQEIKTSLDKIPDLTIVEMVDKAIRLIRGET